MKIKITTSCSGDNFSFMPGETVKVSQELGEDLIGASYAVEVKDSPLPPTKQKKTKGVGSNVGIK